MSTEDRIRAWQEKRRGGAFPTDPQRTALAAAFNRASTLVLDGKADIRAIFRVVVDTLAAFPNGDLGKRREIYARITEGAQAGIAQRAMPEAIAEFWSRRFQAATRAVETDIRRHVDISGPDYFPEGLEELDERLRARARALQTRLQTSQRRAERRSATRDDVAYVAPLSSEEKADLVDIQTQLVKLQAGQRSAGKDGVPRLLTLGPLLLLRFHIIQADSRIALAWAFVGPIIMVAVISMVYFVNGLNFVLGMDVPSFALVGSVTWIMFRMIVFRSSESYFSGRMFLHLEPVTPLLMALVNSLFYFIVYVIVMTVLVTAGYSIGHITRPDNVAGVLACMFGVALIATSFGLLFASVASKWEFFMRLAPPIERALQLFSSVFFVSEQFPAQYRPYILWWPLSHGFQLLRSCYFVGYKSQDASIPYFLISIVIFVAAGLMADRLARSNVQPM